MDASSSEVGPMFAAFPVYSGVLCLLGHYLYMVCTSSLLSIAVVSALARVVGKSRSKTISKAFGDATQRWGPDGCSSNSGP